MRSNNSGFASVLRRGVASLPALVLAVTACGQDSVKTKAGTAQPRIDKVAAYKAAKNLFTTFCSTCHGKTGKGDGPAAVALKPKPRSLSDVTWQRSVSDDHIKKVILEGGAPVKLSPLMAPAKAMLETKPAGTIDQLVRLIRKLAKPTPPAPAAVKSAKRIMTTFCSTCHGTTGNGDGPAAVALKPKPRSLANPLWQSSVSDDHIKKVIMEGGASVKLSPLMAPAKVIIDAEPKGTLEAIVREIRGLRAKSVPAKATKKNATPKAGQQ